MTRHTLKPQLDLARRLRSPWEHQGLRQNLKALQTSPTILSLPMKMLRERLLERPP